MDKPKFYFIIVIFSILLVISGLLKTARSLPLFTLYQNIKLGGMNTLGVTDIESNSVYILEVRPLSPAAEAQLAVGDIIISVNDENINNVSDFMDISNRNKGRSINIAIKRNGESKQIELTPRADSRVNEGSVGVAISNLKIQNETVYAVIYKTLLQNISWGVSVVPKNEIAGPVGVVMGILSQKEYFWPSIFILGIIQIIIAAGLIKLKKWAMFGMFALAFISLAQIMVYLLSATRLNVSLPVSVISFSISVLFVYYLYTQRKFFT